MRVSNLLCPQILAFYNDVWCLGSKVSKSTVLDSNEFSCSRVLLSSKIREVFDGIINNCPKVFVFSKIFQKVVVLNYFEYQGVKSISRFFGHGWSDLCSLTWCRTCKTYRWPLLLWLIIVFVTTTMLALFICT